MPLSAQLLEWQTSFFDSLRTPFPYFIVSPLFLSFFQLPVALYQAILITSITNFILAFSTIHITCSHNLDALVLLQTRFQDAKLFLGNTNTLTRRGYQHLFRMLLDLHATFHFLRNSPLTEYRTDVLEVIHKRSMASVAKSRAYNSVTASSILLSTMFYPWNPLVTSHPRTYVRSTGSAFVTTMDAVIGHFTEDTSDIYNVSYGLSALIPASEPFSCPDQEEVARSNYGTHIGNGMEDWDIFYSSPVFALSYLHRNYDRGSMVKMDPEVWRRVNALAASLTRATDCSHYTLWVDSCVRYRRSLEYSDQISTSSRENLLAASEQEAGDVPWYVYGLLPYALFHTVCDKTETACADTRFWPYLERNLSEAVGKQYIVDGHQFEYHPAFMNVSPITAMRRTALLPRVYGNLQVTFEKDTDMLRAVFQSLACGDFSDIDKNAPQMTQSSRRAALDALWLAVNAFEPHLPLEEDIDPFPDRPCVRACEFDAVRHMSRAEISDLPARPGWPGADPTSPIETRLFVTEKQDWMPQDCVKVILGALRVLGSKKLRKMFLCVMILGYNNDREVLVDTIDSDDIEIEGDGYPAEMFLELVHNDVGVS